MLNLRHQAALVSVVDVNGHSSHYASPSRNGLVKDEMASRPKLSGMQKQVLGLYRSFLRAARKKAPEEQSRIESIISAEFHHNAKNVDRKNFLYIEYLIRRGKKQLEQLNSPDTVGLSTFKFRPSAAAVDNQPTHNKISEPTVLESHNDQLGSRK